MSQRDEVDPRAFRTKRNLAIARLSEAVSPLLTFASSAVARGKRTAPGEWRNGLIISHTHIGDVLYRTCSLGQLADGLPACSWSYLVSSQSAAVLERNPFIAHVLPLVDGENSWDISSDAFLELRRKKFDVVLCTNTLRHYPDLLLATALGIPNRVGFVGKGMSGLINHPVDLNYPRPYPAYFRSLVAAIAGSEDNEALRPRVYPGDAHHREAAAIRERYALTTARPVVACTLSTRQGSGAVSRDVFIEILKAAREIADFDIAFCGSREERDSLSAIASSLPFDVKLLAGELSLLGFAAFLSTCSALLAPDSGPRHIGNAAGIPVFFTRNLSQLAVETGKYCDTETDLIPSGYELVDSSVVEKVIDVRRSAQLLVRSVVG